MFVDETFQVIAMIKQLPPPQKDFKNYLKHKRRISKNKLLDFEQIKTTKVLRKRKRIVFKAFAKANIVEHGPMSKNKHNKINKLIERGSFFFNLKAKTLIVTRFWSQVCGQIALKG